MRLCLAGAGRGRCTRGGMGTTAYGVWPCSLYNRRRWCEAMYSHVNTAAANARGHGADLDSADAAAALGAGELCVCPARCPSIVRQNASMEVTIPFERRGDCIKTN